MRRRLTALFPIKTLAKAANEIKRSLWLHVFTVVQLLSNVVGTQCNLKCKGVNEQHFSMQELRQKEDLVGTEFVHWSTDKPRIGQEIQ